MASEAQIRIVGSALLFVTYGDCHCLFLLFWYLRRLVGVVLSSRPSVCTASWSSFRPRPRRVKRRSAAPLRDSLPAGRFWARDEGSTQRRWYITVFLSVVVLWFRAMCLRYFISFVVVLFSVWGGLPSCRCVCVVEIAAHADPMRKAAKRHT